MTCWLLHALHLLLVLESGRSNVLPEDRVLESGLSEAAAEERVFTHGSAHRDRVSISMLKEYERYSKDPRSHRDGNTVRSFKAVRVLDGRDVFQFNLSSIQESEIILAASLHFLSNRPRYHQRSWRLRRPRRSSAGLQNSYPASPQLLFCGSSPNSASSKSLGSIALSPFKKGFWQTQDVTAAMKRARDTNQLMVTTEFRMGIEGAHGSLERLTRANLPYILIYADDQAIDEPNSVATSLQRYGSFPVGEDASPIDSASDSRIRRDLRIQNQSNDIPEVHYNTLKNHELWQNTYFPTKAKSAVTGRHLGEEISGGLRKPQVLSFDERTMSKARRRQWSEPRVCSRRYLRVDFADIGWSDWVLAPKAFDAYFCAGTCGFPIQKVVRPSNHATIQSIVRAVGIVPGVPEPCCVPEKMSSLSVLFLDPDRNMVLKVYPGMSVETCACR